MAFGPSVLRARIRSAAEDFFVEELPAFEASGVGEHLLLTIEKRGMNTAFAAGRIAKWAGVPEMAVSYAGMKDRHALTRQRFSVHLPGRDAPDVAALESDELRVVDATRHARKLQRGALRGNRFVLRLREVVGDRMAIGQRLQAIHDRGFPNAFGEQRFGRGGGNLDAARAMFAGRRMRRDQRSILLSAARSELFNRVLAARIADGSWDTGLTGEVWMLDGSHSVFGPESDPVALADRVRNQDIHPTGPLWGSGSLRTDAACRALEESTLADASELRVGLEQAGLRQERRALRIPVRTLVWSWSGEDTLELAFELPPGSYATSLLDTLGMIEDAAGTGAPTDGTSGMLRRQADGVD
ncbi:MAG TPA: tRNA pseudouridine(13) synthase TruD [Xanthomonadaceae bacterium]|jgi:tRNA pseudouridine13 synthase|nr:tRNA pseudouridine(13) synthase TruD [Xanthomonadaceae bacterium]